MESKVQVRRALLAFDKIISQGHKSDDGYTLNGITAISDFDGYTAILKNDYVTLSIQFHNTFHFSYINEKEKNTFMEKLEGIIKNSSNVL